MSHSPATLSSIDTTAYKRPIVLSGPSGTGKSTLLKRLFEEYPDTFGFSVSHTTRQPRDGEENGIHYHFVDTEAFQAGIDKEEFVEWAKFSNNHYGTSIEAIRTVNTQGKICILDIDMQGVIQVKKTDLNAYYISVQPPSIEELERRLRSRGTEKEEAVKSRLLAAQGELEYAQQEGSFDGIIVNDNLEEAYKQLKAHINKAANASVVRTDD
ncbi:P-loop containing nucleoside triphosphate hydrolase protein [Mortierella sp. GBAus27b]|nr:P-loop containing nucleoside triphosphate hydrolase protein [Mortierella sp. GBAus27b]